MEKKVQEIISDFKSFPNKDLKYSLDYLNEDFNKTKDLIVRLTKHLDGIEVNYNKILKEYKSRK
jgi:hypothetical protein